MWGVCRYKVEQRECVGLRASLRWVRMSESGDHDWSCHSVQWNPHRAYDEGLQLLHALHAERLKLDLKQLPNVVRWPHDAARAVHERCKELQLQNGEVRASLDAREEIVRDVVHSAFCLQG